MYSCMLKNLETIKKAYKTPGNHLICLEGKKGTGKSTVLREFSTHKYPLFAQNLMAEEAWGSFAEW